MYKSRKELLEVIEKEFVIMKDLWLKKDFVGAINETDMLQDSLTELLKNWEGMGE